MQHNTYPQPNSYFNGQWVDRSELALGVDDLGLQQGVAISERLRTFAGDLFRLDDHLRRLRRSLEIIGIEAEAVCREISAVVPEVAERNRIGLEEGDDLSLVLFVTPGLLDRTDRRPGSQSSRPIICVYARPLPFADWVDFYQRGDRIVVSQVQQVPAGCWPPELKCRSRMHYFLADRAAAERDPGARAVVLDASGHVCEASTANLVIVRDGSLFSPRLEAILPGVSLSMARHLAGELKIPFKHGDIWPDQLRSADEILLASTSTCLLPVTSCDGHEVGDGQPGEIFHRLIQAWSQHVGVDIAAQAQKFRSRR